MNISLIFFFAVVCHLNLSIARAQFHQCYTPDRRLGSCIDVYQCSSILAKLSQEHIPDADRTFIKKSRCGHFGSLAVCCPLSYGLNISDLPQPGTCGVQEEFRIIGGEVTHIREFAWMALIEYTKINGKGFHCGGVLINKDYVLTAAHCVTGISVLALGWRLSGVRLGEWDLGNNTTDCSDDYCAPPVLDIPVVESIVHENYNRFSKAKENDIALLRLRRSVEFNDMVKPICLPVSSRIVGRNYDNFPMIVSGWGTTENRSQSNIKLKVGVKGVPLGQCNNVYRNSRVRLSQKHLCAGGVQGKDSCRGDSGGPLMALDHLSDPLMPHFYLAGLVSFGRNECGVENWPGVYTRVDRYIDWILSHMRP